MYSLKLQSVTLSPYAQYCANLVTAKLVLETKKQDPAFDDFLQVYTVHAHYQPRS